MDKTEAFEKLQAEFDELAISPTDEGLVELITCRPDFGERQMLEAAEIDLQKGLIGDNWHVRPSRHTEDGGPHMGCQITLMNSKVIDLITHDKEKWMWAGDNLFVDFDLSLENLPIGQQIQVGEVALEVSEMPHNACGKFNQYFGSAATKVINSREGRRLRWRGVNMRIIQGGTIKVGDVVRKK